MLSNDLMRYVFNFLPINFTIDSTLTVNKKFYKHSKIRTKINPEDVILLNNSFTRIKRFYVIMIRKRNNRRKRFSSWKSKIRHPDERIIF